MATTKTNSKKPTTDSSKKPTTDSSKKIKEVDTSTDKTLNNDKKEEDENGFDNTSYILDEQKEVSKFTEFEKQVLKELKDIRKTSKSILKTLKKLNK